MHRHGNRPDVTIWACVFHFCLSYFSDWKTWIEIIGIYIYLFFLKIFILLVERKPHVRCTEIKKKILHFSQRRILFFLGEERDCAAASGGLTFSIPSLKGVWGL